MSGLPELAELYLTVNPDVAGLGAFLRVDGGDTAVATGTGAQTLVARGTADGSGNLTLSWGVQDIGAGQAGAGTDDLDGADQAALEADGWTFTNTNTGGGSFTFASGVDVGPFGTSLTFNAKNNGVGMLQMSRTFTVVNGQTYTGKLWADASSAEPWWAALNFDLLSGANSGHDSINGGEAAQQLAASVVASGTSLTVRVRITPPDFFGGVKPWRIAGLTLDGLAGGGAEVDFSEVASCTGTGLGETGGAA